MMSTIPALKIRILFLAICMNLFACGSPEDNLTDNKELEHRNALRQIYGKVTGLYRGQVNSEQDGTIPAEIKIYIIEVADGVNSNGEVRFRPELKGYFQRLDIDSGNIPPISLIVRFYRETNEVIMKNSEQQGSGSGGPLPDSRFISISSQYSDGKINGTINYQKNKSGTIQIERVAN